MRGPDGPGARPGGRSKQIMGAPAGESNGTGQFFTGTGAGTEAPANVHNGCYVKPALLSCLSRIPVYN